MSLILPDHVDAARLAAQGVTLEGDIPASSLHRLAAAYAEIWPVAVSVHVGLSELRQVVIRGTVHGRVTATCQRCLQPVSLAVSGEFEHLPEVEEMLDPRAPAGTLDLLALIEDEMFLACPMIPRHDTRECPDPVHDEERSVPSEAGGRKNPFDVLAALRHTSRDKPRENDAASNSEE